MTNQERVLAVTREECMLATEDSERQKGIRLPGDVFRGSFCGSVSIYTVGS